MRQSGGDGGVGSPRHISSVGRGDGGVGSPRHIRSGGGGGGGSGPVQDKVPFSVGGLPIAGDQRGNDNFDVVVLYITRQLVLDPRQTVDFIVDSRGRNGLRNELFRKLRDAKAANIHSQANFDGFTQMGYNGPCRQTSQPRGLFQGSALQ